MMASLLLVVIPLVRSAENYSGYSLLRFPADEPLTKWLADMESIGFVVDEKNQKRRLLIDVWGTPSKWNPAADVLVAPEFLKTFLNLLEKRGVYQVEMLKDDISKDIRRERRHLEQISRRAKTKALVPWNLTSKIITLMTRW
ncbi:hypothetical protein KIN20_003771 [Parelaphostrongylus tenuis]|uniref:Carboxypeptidase activation peptide domain-containing protein n=1 Tax=Parelaphostrongylus tenuis TaxID=148309 RepID=A0AAD5MIX2_PARTN|nr:hypothetical protein KIN20_003771 [Parelaphostrongylus tenuis]